MSLFSLPHMLCQVSLRSGLLCLPAPTNESMGAGIQASLCYPNKPCSVVCSSMSGKLLAPWHVTRMSLGAYIWCPTHLSGNSGILWRFCEVSVKHYKPIVHSMLLLQQPICTRISHGQASLYISEHTQSFWRIHPRL